MKPNYIEPKIYTGGIDISKWSSLTKTQQNDALKKQWFVYFSFRDPKTGKQKRQPYIKGGANRYKDKTKRLQFLKVLQRNLLLLLEAGFDPYKDNSELEAKFLGKPNEPKLGTVPKQVSKAPAKEVIAPLTSPPTRTTCNSMVNDPVHEEKSKPEEKVSVEEAFEIGLRIKKNTLNDNSYPKYKSRINRFQRWLEENKKEIDNIKSINKKTVIQYLNSVLEKTSPRNRNNARTALSSLFTTLVDNELIPENFILRINVEKSIPERNKTYTPKLVEDIDRYLKEHDPILRLFIQFISYNLLRPIEVCRLKVGDLDISDRRIYVRAKNKPVKIKIIPEILLDELPDISKMNKENPLFTPNGLGDLWNVSETEKRNYFTKRFRKVKNHFNLGKDYGLYSFRHTYITRMFRKMERTATPLEVKSRLMLITGHTTLTALEKYLRDIDAALPEDYSQLLKPTKTSNS
ncbi:tyrosine-type recombinase/integrase [Maribacter luteus]|nr:site-specific integrase [Maribacter luteus]